MALINCPECKQHVSTAAEACPHCGYKLAGGAPGAVNKGMPVWGIVLIVLGGLALLGIPVIGIMAAVAIPKLHSAIEKSKVGAACGDIGAFNSALALYQVDIQDKTFPTRTLRQLYSDNTPGWSGPYMATITRDPWHNEYEYQCSPDGTSYAIQSVHRSDFHKAETIRYLFSTGVVESIP